MSEPKARRPRIVVSHWVHEGILDALAAHGEVVANRSREPWPYSELRARCRRAEALIAFMPDRVDESLLSGCPELKIVAAALKGYDNIDVEAATRRGVWVTAVDDLLTAPTAELAVGLLLALLRNVLPGDARMRTGTFDGWRPTLYGATLTGSRIGLLGLGRVGRAVAARLRGFDAVVRYADPVAAGAERERALGVERMPYASLLAWSDRLIVTVPLLPSTVHFVDARALATLPRGAFLVNVGRGSVIDEEAVGAALESGHLAGYAADVFALEDLSRDARPRAVPAALLASRERTVLTPHLGSAVDEVRYAIAHAAALAVIDQRCGRTPRGALNHPLSEAGKVADAAPPSP